MGNASTLPYDIEQQVAFNSGINWTLHDACKKVDREDLKEPVSLFRVSKTANLNDLAMAQRTIHKLRTLKHPYVLKFLDTADMDESLALVTEHCIPLETWITSSARNNQDRSEQHDDGGQEDDPVKLQEILWGFKCILLAINFLHTNCSVLHANLGIHSIFVTPNGDWKLAGFELCGNMSVPADLDNLIKNGHLLNSFYCSPERLQSEALRAKNPPYYVDMYSFGQCIHKVFALLSLEVPRGFGKYLSAVQHADYKKRPTAQKLCESAMFHSEHLQFIESIGELALKQPKEFLEVISQMEPKVAGLSRAVCAHKILPNLARTLQIAINDFPLRDAREGCRQSIQVSVNLLSKLASLNKLDPAVFRASWVPLLVQLWAMSDRSVRTVMLQSLKALVPFVPDAVVNKSIFDNVLAGFADSNAKLRESTLMSLIFIVDKLEETQLQDRLVRSILSLQSDAEPSIRTNATIFLGKIASKLKETVRVRVLCAAFQKAMKDNFMHCRVAGLRTANACVKLLDPAQMASKLVPQASILLLDKAAEVRSLAFTLIESCLDLLKAHHEVMLAQARAEGRNNNNTSAGTPSKLSGAVRSSSDGTSTSTSTAEEGGGTGGWNSWSVLQGISKSLESATIVSATIATNPSSSSSSSSSSAHPGSHPPPAPAAAAVPASTWSGGGAKKVAELSHSASMVSNGSDSMFQAHTHNKNANSSSGGFGGDDNDYGGNDNDDLDFDPDMHDDSSSSRQQPQQQRQGGGGWDEQFDDLDLGDGLDDSDSNDGDSYRANATRPSASASAVAPAAVPAGRQGGLGLGLGGLKSSSVAAASHSHSPGGSASSVPAPRGMNLKASSLSAAAEKEKEKAGGKAPKVAITKLSVTKGEKDNWDDF